MPQKCMPMTMTMKGMMKSSLIKSVQVTRSQTRYHFVYGRAAKGSGERSDGELELEPEGGIETETGDAIEAGEGAAANSAKSTYDNAVSGRRARADHRHIPASSGAGTGACERCAAKAFFSAPSRSAMIRNNLQSER